MRAFLTGPSATTTASTQQSDRFALLANLAATSTACYNDTIFRDDFDGDGL